MSTDVSKATSLSTAELEAFTPAADRLEATREKLSHVEHRARLTLEAMAEVGADFARYKAEHVEAYGLRPPRGQGFEEWAARTFEVSSKTVQRYILLHENRHLITGATSLRGALGMVKEATSPTDVSGHVSGEAAHEARVNHPTQNDATPRLTGEVFVGIVTAEGVITAKRQELQRKAERAEVEILTRELHVTEAQAWAYVTSKRKPLRPVKPRHLPSGWKEARIPLPAEETKAISEAVLEAAKKTRRKPHKLYEECVLRLGLEAFRKKYDV